MTNSLAEQLTAQFYEWERHGRGWDVFPNAVDLEPPFVPFFYHVAPRVYVDDGFRPTLLQKLGSFIKDIGKNEEIIENDDSPLEPFPSIDDSPLHVFSISLPKGEKVKAAEMEQLLIMFSYSASPVSFEIIATHITITIQFVCRELDVLLLKSQLKAYFPSIIITEKTESLWDIIPDDYSAYAIEYGLSEEFMRPISMTNSFELDPYTGIFGMLDHLSPGEQAAIQIIFKGAVNSWAESILQSVTDQQGGSFFIDAPEMVKLAQEKVSSPLFGVTARVIGCGSSHSEARGIANNISNAFMQTSASNSNKLIPLAGDRESPDQFYKDIMLRQSHRLGMLLNGKELATIAHLPSASIVSPKLERDVQKTKSAPAITEGNDFTIGFNYHQGKEKEVTLSGAQRLKHTHIIGATGTGKSTFLLNLIASDMDLGNGIAVLDPHGDLIESIIHRIPENRIQDVIVIDPADSEYPIGFNILTAHSDIEKEILSSDLVAAFKRLSTSWGDQMNSVFANAILAFLESDNGGTLVDVRRFLIEKNFRDTFLKSVTDPNIVYYWQKEFPILKSSSIGPILTRLDTFLRPKLIRNMVVQNKSLDFESILDSKKILLIKLSQGLIGTENSYLLGTFIVSKIHQAAMARQSKSKEERSDFFVYIDEFQNFITPSMSSILSGARKYHLGLILAHQDMQQLIKQDSELASSVLSNAGTRICFRIGDADARKFEDGFSFFEAKDLQNLETGEAIVRVDRPEFDFNIITFPLPEIDSSAKECITDSVIMHSRNLYGTPRKEVEEALKELHIEIKSDENIVIENKNSIPPIPIPKEAIPELKAVLTPISEIKSNEIISSLSQQKTQSEHRYMQAYIKRMAESRGFKAAIEELTPDGKGRVDVSLERNGFKIACEVAMTTTETWEVHNIEKCLAAGYDVVVECSKEKKTLEKIKDAVNKKIPQSLLSKILIVEPDSLIHYLDTHITKESSTETRMKGYRVKVEYESGSAEDIKRKKESVVKTVLESLKRTKK